MKIHDEQKVHFNEITDVLSTFLIIGLFASLFNVSVYSKNYLNTLLNIENVQSTHTITKQPKHFQDNNP